MTTLTQWEIEQLQYALNVYSFETGDDSEEILLLKNKLFTIRAEMEVDGYSSFSLTEEQINNTL